MKTIVLFTGSYPYSVALEDTFIEPELEVLSKHHKIIIIPLAKKGNRSRFVDKLQNVKVYEDLDEFNKNKIFLYLKNIDGEFFKELKYITNKKHFIDLLKYYLRYIWIKDNIKKLIKNNVLNADYIYYTYWFDYTTTALRSLKKQFNLKVITRTHRYDLYEERRGGYIPFRKDDVRNIDKIVTISMQGYNYLKRKYNLQNLYNSYLGVKDLHIINPINISNTLKIVSCALMSPVKRIDMIMEYLSNYSKKYNINIEWHHIGNGILENELKQQKKKLQNDNFIINFVGFLENRDIFEYYKKNSFDYFITLSASEGLPVSLMEACSVGLPIIATDVGGISEIVKNEVNGFLLSANPDFGEFENILTKAINLKKSIENYKKMREKSRDIYIKNFNSNDNHEKFAEFLERF
ncbi:glycosyltransferase [Hippea jasoniae]|uniref:glycosyltransferase n=1 Tax=Hippea jasoniae TaxID=944479 RepID=UPI00054F4C80|nr:glycosyltransferase [Hippea jasoniae]